MNADGNLFVGAAPFSVSTRRFAFGGGRVVLGADGAPTAFEHVADPDRLYLLDETVDAWHGPDHHWGAGFANTSRGSGRWQTPYVIEWRADGATASHRPVAGLELEVRRRVAGERYTEVHTWTNTGDEPLRITGLGLNVPVRDVYDGAATALARSCHAHVFTGGRGHGCWPSRWPARHRCSVRSSGRARCGRTRSSPATP
ncbi:hypothetical protein [Streptomyces litchfieldiae]|uniref:Uncharacterized protein n=1 Tax=Streptomyces litchfieldiae TaxID=3075543 RepID=A0ABU2MS61_9ACTN|nr:hypothetical protein [Streptomyces sp. DSM 44938]MDT0344462.1 hypothetical protein [Streptomyces sp. DSM 44938]